MGKRGKCPKSELLPTDVTRLLDRHTRQISELMQMLSWALAHLGWRGSLQQLTHAILMHQAEQGAIASAQSMLQIRTPMAEDSEARAALAEARQAGKHGPQQAPAAATTGSHNRQPTTGSPQQAAAAATTGSPQQAAAGQHGQLPQAAAGQHVQLPQAAAAVPQHHAPPWQQHGQLPQAAAAVPPPMHPPPSSNKVSSHRNPPQQPTASKHPFKTISHHGQLAWWFPSPCNTRFPSPCNTNLHTQ